MSPHNIEVLTNYNYKKPARIKDRCTGFPYHPVVFSPRDMITERINLEKSNNKSVFPSQNGVVYFASTTQHRRGVSC